MHDPLKVTLLLGALVVLMYVLAGQARKRLGMGAGKMDPSSLRVVGKRMLEPRKALYVVEIADRYILVGTSENSVSLVDRISADEFARIATPPPAAPLRPVGEEQDGDDVDGDAEAAAHAPQQQFATVGESFALLLSKVRNRKAS